MIIRSYIYLLLLLISATIVRADQLPVIPEKNTAFDSIKSLGNDYVVQGKYKEAFEKYFQALRIAEKANNRFLILQVSNNIAITYLKTGDISNADKWARKAEKELGATTNGITKGNVYNTLGEVASGSDHYPQALGYFTKAKEYYETAGDVKRIAISYNNIGSAYYEMNNLEQAIAMSRESAKMRLAIQDTEGIAGALLNVAEYYMNWSEKENSPVNYDSALAYMNKGFEYGKSTGSLSVLRQYYEKYAFLYSSLGNYKKAYEFEQLCTVTNNKILDEKRLEQITEMQTLYETEKKEQENRLLLQQNRIQQLEIGSEKGKRNTVIIAALILIGLIVISAVFVYQRKKQQQQLQLQHELNKQQKLQFKAAMEAEDKERTRIARELHDGIGQLLSTARLNVAGLEDGFDAKDNEDVAIYRSSLELIDEACNEVRNISHNLMPGALITLGLAAALQELTNRLNKSKLITASLNTENFSGRTGEATEFALYRIAQELVHNALKHAHATSLQILLEKKNETVLLRVKDNGSGMDSEKIRTNPGMGWKNIQLRVALFNGTIDIQPVTGQGTEVTIRLNAV